MVKAKNTVLKHRNNKDIGRYMLNLESLGKDVWLVDRAIYFAKSGLLVLSDIHLAYEQYLVEMGVMIPLYNSKRMLSDIEDIINHIKARFKLNRIKSIVLNGDIKHEFSKLSFGELKYTKKLLKMMLECGDQVIVIRGNHDNYIKTIASKLNITTKDYLIYDNVYIEHGHKNFYDKISKKEKESIKYIIIGHEHPALMLKDKGNIRKERYHCFVIMKGIAKLRDKVIILMPAFNQMFMGTDFLSHLGTNFLGEFMNSHINDISRKSIDIVIYSQQELFYFPAGTF